LQLHIASFQRRVLIAPTQYATLGTSLKQVD
jgi:hypothetical protein